MYCIQCGVKLADTERVCPLCHTKVCHPDFPPVPEEKSYPAGRHPEVQPRSFLAPVMLTVLFLLPMIVVAQCDLLLNGRITWSGFVAGALMLLYVMLVLPAWFRRPNPVIFVPCTFGALGLYLLYIDLAIRGNWFVTFALPVTAGVGLIVTAVVTLIRYVKKGYLYIFGGACIALGALMLGVEFLLEMTFAIGRFVGWSLYPLTAMVLLGGFLIFLGINRPAREAMERKLFL